MKSDTLSIGEAIQFYRERQSYSRYHVARKAGMCSMGLKGIEQGKTCPTLYSIKRIAIALDTHPSRLIFTSTNQLRTLPRI